MSKFPLVSLIVLNWNGKELLRRCLRSIESIDYPNVEVIVVDNASTDSSVDMVREEFPSAKIIVNALNLGFAGGNNEGIRIARGEIVALINNDVILDRNWVTFIAQAIMNNPKIGIVGGKIFYAGSNNLIYSAGGKVSYLRGTVALVGMGRQDSSEFSKSRLVDHVAGCAMAFRRDLVKKVGLLDPEYFLYVEETDFCFRARRANYKISYVPEAIAWHLAGGTTRCRPSRYRFKVTYTQYLVFRNRVRFILKNFDHLWIFTALFSSAVYFWLASIVTALKEHSPNAIFLVLRAITWNVKNLRKTLLSRATDLSKLQ